MRGSGATRLAHTHTQARQEHLQVAAAEARQQGEAAPQPQGQRDDGAAHAAIRPGCDGQDDRDVEQREGSPGEQPHGRIRDPELRLDRIDEHREQLPVDDVEHRHAGQQTEHVARVGGGELLFRMTGGAQPFLASGPEPSHPRPGAGTIGQVAVWTSRGWGCGATGARDPHPPMASNPGRERSPTLRADANAPCIASRMPARGTPE